jgi:CheY-like chemotaxis protein
MIEDNAADVLLLQKALDEEGFPYVMTHFEDGPEAVRALCTETRNPDMAPDVIVLDLNLPGGEGIQVLQQIRQTPWLALVPVAILTSSESPGDRRRSEDLGADRFILKPAELDSFFLRVGGGIRELLSEGRRRKLAEE